MKKWNKLYYVLKKLANNTAFISYSFTSHTSISIWLLSSLLLRCTFLYTNTLWIVRKCFQLLVFLFSSKWVCKIKNIVNPLRIRRAEGDMPKVHLYTEQTGTIVFFVVVVKVNNKIWRKRSECSSVVFIYIFSFMRRRLNMQNGS